jgi:AcrR family transcriptional regulator
MNVTTRQTAEERRETVLEAAAHEFAHKGLYGTSTEDIARAAGISQPYLFRLFGSKKALYLAAYQHCVDEVYVAFAAAARGRSGEDALHAMGQAFTELMQNRDRLMFMLKTWATCDDEEICRAARADWRNLVDLAEQASGEPPEVVTRFFANGMLISILMSMDLLADPEPWANRLLASCKLALET